MKKIFIGLLSLTTIFQSCKKNKAAEGLSGLTVVNANPGLAAAYVNASGQNLVYARVPSIDVLYFVNGNIYAANAGSKNIVITSTADTTKPLFSQPASFRPGGMSSLFLAGQFPAIDAVYLDNESFPRHAEEVIGIRVINLSANAGPVSVNLAASPDKPEVSALNYKQVSAFKNYAASNASTPINFEIRDNGTNALLATYALPVTASNNPYPRITVGGAQHLNLTLVIKGLVGGSGTSVLEVFPVAHY